MQLFDEAYRIVQGRARFLGAERVALHEAPGRILAQDVASDLDMPPFDKSAMDGYACRRRDLRNELAVVETIAAGGTPSKAVRPDECAKIMTGAMVPEGADCVIKVEDTEQVDETIVRFTGAETPENICRRGEDIRQGDLVLGKGERLRPQHIGVLATVGCARPLVARRPQVAVIATGDELVEPDQTPQTSQIRNSNGHQLRAHVAATGAVPVYGGIGPDTEDALDTMIREALSENDVVLLSGGVSMGDFDLVPRILEKNGVQLLFERIAVKPGMPTVFGLSETSFCFGLPGNPVSTFVLFEILVKPFLLKLMGHDFRPPVIPMSLAKPISRKKTDRDSWIPVTITGNGTVCAVEYHGSAHLNALTRADGLICVARGVATVEEGTKVDVRQI